MSSHDIKLILSPKAEEDFSDILQYTLENWGEEKTYAYRDVINKALLTIAQYPNVGYIRKEFSNEHKLLPAGQHLIIYKVMNSAVYISRILHEKMDSFRHLDN